ncbi:MAG: hypothetical protein KJ550_05470 [Proteobacteria bacterium]|nr:hypothetical protein [Desulfobacteraceae bacterium]MBU4012897.1 hypothetical protein [Pseudomonadota bacterium]MBU4100973.1 hypothetical protein [Pseudomonadota bacterium]MBU4128201.1 hypothetical protein [Pseudomonadota bacterium]
MRRMLSGHFRNKGVTLITLIIAITIFAVFITVFSYVMIAKHGSEALYVQSTQAYAIAQAGIEYSIRYAMDVKNPMGKPGFLADPTNENYFPKNQALGDGSFNLVYDNSNNTLTSTGTVGVAEREIILQRFRVWVAGQAITLDPSEPPY